MKKPSTSPLLGIALAVAGTVLCNCSPSPVKEKYQNTWGVHQLEDSQKGVKVTSSIPSAFHGSWKLEKSGGKPGRSRLLAAGESYVISDTSYSSFVHNSYGFGKTEKKVYKVEIHSESEILVFAYAGNKKNGASLERTVFELSDDGNALKSSETEKTYFRQ